MLEFRSKQLSSNDIYCYLGELICPDIRLHALEAIRQLNNLIINTSEPNRGRKIDESSLRDIKSTLITPFKEVNFSEVSQGNPLFYLGNRKGGFVNFALGPNIRNLIFDRGGQLLQNTDRDSALIVFKFGSGLQLGAFEGDELPFTRIHPIGYMVFRAAKFYQSHQNFGVVSREFAIVFTEQVSSNEISCHRFLILYGERYEEQVDKEEGNKAKVIDIFRLFFLDNNYVWGACEKVDENSYLADRSHMVFHLQNLSAGQRLVARDWLAFLKRFIDSLPYQLETKAQVTVIEKKIKAL